MVELVEQNFEENKKLFNRVLKELQDEIGTGVPIEHVGSTAIPNMIGKNIIDVLVGAKDEASFELLKHSIERLGYFPSERSANSIYQFFASKKEETGSGDVHIHLVMIGTKRYNDFIILRDYLLKNEDEALAYAECKRNILNNITADRSTYRSVKSEYVSKLIERANAAMN